MGIFEEFRLLQQHFWHSSLICRCMQVSGATLLFLEWSQGREGWWCAASRGIFSRPMDTAARSRETFGLTSLSDLRLKTEDYKAEDQLKAIAWFLFRYKSGKLWQGRKRPLVPVEEGRGSNRVRRRISGEGREKMQIERREFIICHKTNLKSLFF